MFEKVYSLKLGKIAVVPLAGTWIEIRSVCQNLYAGTVVPLAGTWIEICFGVCSAVFLFRRSPRGNVD